MPRAELQNRRRFERIPFDHDALIVTDDGQRACELLDISFRGALLALNEEWQPSQDQNVDLVIPLADTDDLRITMTGTVVRLGDPGIALRCDRMDIDSMTLLRRLVEMNLGDASMLERELSAFID